MYETVFSYIILFVNKLFVMCCYQHFCDKIWKIFSIWMESAIQY